MCIYQGESYLYKMILYKRVKERLYRTMIRQISNVIIQDKNQHQCEWIEIKEMRQSQC